MPPARKKPNLTLNVNAPPPRTGSAYGNLPVPTPTNRQMAASTPKIKSMEFGHHPETPSTARAGKQKSHFNEEEAGLKDKTNNESRFVPTPANPAVSRDIKTDVDFSELTNLVYIASGEFANVFTGTWGDKRIAVKILKEEYLNNPRALGDFHFEMKLMAIFDPTQFLVEMYGGGICEGRPFIVMEELPNGTLDENFKDFRTYKDKVSVLLNIAKALKHMHEVCLPHYIVMHRDLKPKNIAMNADRIPKLLDFGLSRVIETRTNMKSPDFPMHTIEEPSNSSSSFRSSGAGGAGEKSGTTTPTTALSSASSNNENDMLDEEELFDMTGETGSLRYMAPEIARCDKYNHKADCYSWAILAWQVMTKTTPYSGMGVKQFTANVVKGKQRMNVPNNWPRGLPKLVKDCWDNDIRKRPSLKTVVATLEDIVEEMDTNVVANGGCGCVLS
ncbi:hypothetical protein TrVE_jg7942 [Triparma verrucosa]|uniref:Protein kinase domain-containing protein n=1 Tax=Triparma verrucosa TaxID=1606542 RepID=A0A9W7CL57_9STRA|nr:hypothetical protein TrVE_jg7942 [Triparma verrucosa]